MHSAIHYLGMDVHDVGRYDAGRPRALEPGVVITVEPGHYFGADEANVPERYRGIGVRIEDDVLIEPLGARVSSFIVPQDPGDIERACRL